MIAGSASMMFPFRPLMEEISLIADLGFDYLELAMDTGHANIGSGGNHRLLEFVRRFGGRIGHVHLSDNRGQSDDHLPLGSGTIDFARFARFARELGVSGYGETVTLEIFSDDRGDLARSRDAFQAL